MAAPLQRIRWPGWSAWLVAGVVAALGAVWIARLDLARQRDAFDTDARIAHRLLSQRVVQHDAILATLALLQPRDDAAERLPALYPQVLQVLRRDRGTTWPDPALQTAEAASRAQQRAVLAAVDAGRYTLVRAAEPASFALRIAIDAMVPWSEWPMRRDGPVRVALQLGHETIPLQPGSAAVGVARFDFAKHLAADSQPFDMVASRPIGWGELPWAAMSAWIVGAALLAGGITAWQRQREARRRAEELLRLGQVGRLNALGELAAGMAHELNQPLTALLANTQAARRLLADDPPDLAEAREAMAQAVQQARRASDVVGRLRRVVQQPSTPAPAQALPLAATVRSALDLLQPELARRGVVPRLGLGDPALAVHADPVAVEQIVHNLLTNALQALDHVPGSERELAIDTEAGEREASLVVRDSGPGIAAEALPHLFEPFFTTRSDGLGLGLSLCETLAAGMGGRLTAANRSPRGAEFRLTLPRVVVASA